MPRPLAAIVIVALAACACACERAKGRFVAGQDEESLYPQLRRCHSSYGDSTRTLQGCKGFLAV